MHRVMVSEEYGHGGRERLSFSSIAGENGLGDVTYHIIQVPVLLRCRQGEEQKQLAFFL